MGAQFLFNLRDSYEFHFKAESQLQTLITTKVCFIARRILLQIRCLLINLENILLGQRIRGSLKSLLYSENGK